MREFELTININKKYSFPRDISIKMLSDRRILVIDPITPNWITLKSHQEYIFFKTLLNGKTINQIIKQYQLSEDSLKLRDLRNVLIEIHNNNFTSKKIRNKNLIDICNLTVYMTDRCNLKCIHCYRFKHNSKIELSTLQWKNVILQYSLLKNRGEFITFSGGEVSLRNDFKEILSYSYSLGLKSIILTNGVIWHKKDYKVIAKFAHEIQVSLDGINELQNDNIRGNGTFKKVINSLKIIANQAQLSNPDLRIALAMTFMPQDLPIIEEKIIDFRNKIIELLKCRVIFRISTRLKPGRKIKKLDLTDQNYYRKFTTRIKNKVYNDMHWESKLMSFTSFSPFIKIKNCGFGQNIGVFSNGDVMACSESNNEFVGNVEDISLENIQSKLLRLFDSTSIENMDLCKNCDLKYICGGGCRLDNIEFTNSYIKPSICIQNDDFKNFIYNIMADRREWSWNC